MVAIFTGAGAGLERGSAAAISLTSSSLGSFGRTVAAIDPVSP